MARELLTTWNGFQSALDRLLALAEKEILIYDGDLDRLKLDTPSRLEHLKRLLQPRRPDCVRIALRETTALENGSPRLMSLLASYSGSMTIVKTPVHLDSLRDSMILVDGCHGLVLFDRNQPRSKLLVHETGELASYRERFEQILLEGCAPVSATTLGL